MYACGHHKETYYSNSEAFTSELLVNLEEMFLLANSGSDIYFN